LAWASARDSTSVVNTGHLDIHLQRVYPFSRAGYLEIHIAQVVFDYTWMSRQDYNFFPLFD
jgi:hypothetical protein